MKMKKTEHKIYAAWNFDKEVEMYNSKSKNGWQAVKVGCFCQKYVWDDSVTYRYQLDYNNDIDDKRRYIETFEEQGWEYLNSSFNNWHVFRKKYQEGLPEKEYQIYTDKASKAEMICRWTRLVKFFTIVISAIGILQLWNLWKEPQLAQLCVVGMYVIFVGVFSYGYYSMKLMSNDKTPKYSIGKRIPFLIVMGFATIYVVLSFLRPSVSDKLTSDSYSVQDEQGYEVLTSFDVKYPDNYYLSLNINDEYPVTIQVTDKEGNEVLSNTAMKMDKKGMKMKLANGKYELRMTFASSDYQGSKVDIAYDIN